MKPRLTIPPLTLAPFVTLTAGRMAPSGLVSVVKVPAPEATPGVSAMPLLLVSVRLSGLVLPAVRLAGHGVREETEDQDVGDAIVKATTIP